MMLLLSIVGGIGLFHAAEAGAVPVPVRDDGVRQGGGGLLLSVDTFPRCAKQRRCWYGSNGRLRCGYATRCQSCRWVKRCSRAIGCRFVESCKWGPYKPVLQTN